MTIDFLLRERGLAADCEKWLEIAVSKQQKHFSGKRLPHILIDRR